MLGAVIQVFNKTQLQLGTVKVDRFWAFIQDLFKVLHFYVENSFYTENSRRVKKH